MDTSEIKPLEESIAELLAYVNKGDAEIAATSRDRCGSFRISLASTQAQYFQAESAYHRAESWVTAARAALALAILHSAVAPEAVPAAEAAEEAAEAVASDAESKMNDLASQVIAAKDALAACTSGCNP